MRLPLSRLVALLAVGTAACGPTYVVQGPPPGAPQQRVPEPPPTPPMEVNIVRTEENRVMIQTSRQAYIAVFEIVPGRGVSLVYPAPMRPRNIQQTGLTWVNVYWTMRPDYRYASAETRYIYAVASDTPLRLEDELYDARAMQRTLGSAYWSSSPNAAVRAIAREFVRAQPDAWWGEDMTSMAMRTDRVNIVIRLARVYCPDGQVYEVRDDLVDRIWCPVRRGGPRAGERPGAAPPDSVFGSNGRRVARRMDPNVRTPVYRVPAGNEVGQQQGQPTTQPHNQPPQTQPPQTQPPQTQPPQTQPQDHDDNGRRAHGDPRNADPRGNGNGYGNGGRGQQQPGNSQPGNGQPTTQPTTPAPSTNAPATVPPQSNGQPQQQGQPQSQPNNNNGQNHGSGNANGDANGNNGKGPNDAKPDHADTPKTGVSAILKNRGPQAKQDKKEPADSTDKKKP